MDLFEPTRQAFALLASGDARLWGTIWISLWVALAAVALTAPAAITVGFLLAKIKFPGRRLLIVLMQALLSFPTVVIGLVIAVPVLLAGGGVAVATRRKGRAERGDAASPATTTLVVSPPEAPTSPQGEPTPSVDDSLDLKPATVPPGGIDAEPHAPEERVPETPAPETPEPEPATYQGRLGKARGLLSSYLGAVRSKGKIDAGTWDDLEEALIRADVGVGATDVLLDDLRGRDRKSTRLNSSH